MLSGLTKDIYNSSYLDEISLSGLFLRAKISPFQKACANNYATLKKIFSYTVVQPKVTNIEYNFLNENELMPLEATSASKMCDELLELVNLTSSKIEKNVKLADKIFEIRVKELRYIFANVPPAKMNEMESGYTVLDRYLEFIAG